MRQFQEDERVPFFVLSLKAGGAGLNLTAASHVVHFDRWWNPAVENQATDRAFRIGQTKNVLVHKFVCRGTVEEKIDRAHRLEAPALRGSARRRRRDAADRDERRRVAEARRARSRTPRSRSDDGRMTTIAAGKPYVSVAARRRRPRAKLAKLQKKGRTISPVVIEGRTIARTFWGKAWCDNLERYSDYANRLPRGRTYVRNGSVVDLQIAPGRSRRSSAARTMYEVKVTVGAGREARWNAICKDCAGAIDSLVELLQGRFSKGVMARLCQQKTGLFPSPTDINFTCSCPDWASMCKHVAAVLYGIGARLDQQPELLFTLRKVDQQDLIANAGADLAKKGRRPAGAKVLASDDLSEMFGIEMAPGDVGEAGCGRPVPTKPSTAGTVAPSSKQMGLTGPATSTKTAPSSGRWKAAADSEEATSNLGAHAHVLGRAASRLEEAEDVRVAVNQPWIGNESRRLTPVLDAQPRDSDHVIDVGRHEGRVEREGMCRDGGVEILNPRPTAFQGRLDAAEHLADDIGPLGPWELCGDEIKARLQRRPALRPRKTLDAKRDLGKHRLRYGDVGWCACRQSFDDWCGAFHERRHGVGVQDVHQRTCGSFERRACFTALSSSSAAALVSGSTRRSRSRNSGSHAERTRTAAPRRGQRDDFG